MPCRIRRLPCCLPAMTKRFGARPQSLPMASVNIDGVLAEWRQGFAGHGQPMGRKARRRPLRKTPQPSGLQRRFARAGLTL
jgi:hypothetical protein